MADRYWVGGAGTWNTTSTTNWSASSGGASGASVPTTADNVFFDQAGTYTVTCTGALACLDITVSAGTVTFANGTSPSFTISGSLFFVAGTVWSTTGNILFNATTTGKTITPNGATFSPLNFTFNGVGGGWTLGSALTTSSSTTIYLTAGTLDTSASGYAITANAFNSSSTSTRVLNLNSSIITLSAASPFTVTAGASLTYNYGTSEVRFTNTATEVGVTYSGAASTNLGNFRFSSTSGNALTFYGTWVMNNLTLTPVIATGAGDITFDNPVTISGTLAQAAPTSPWFRRRIVTSVPQTIRTLTVGATSLTDVDFAAITITGAAAPVTGTRLGNCGGNSGITFPAAKTVYWGNTAGAAWGSNSWSATSGGAVAPANFPLAQDTAIFPAATYPASGSTVTASGVPICSVDMSLRTANTLTLGLGSSSLYGSVINGTGGTITGGNVVLRPVSTTHTFNSAGKTMSWSSIAIQSYTGGAGGTLTLTGALSVGAITLSKGTFALGSYTLTCASFSTGTSAFKALDFGTGSITSSSTGTVFNIASGTETNLSILGSRTVNLTSVATSISTITVVPGALPESKALDFNFTSGTYILSFMANTSSGVRNVNFTGYSGSWGGAGASSFVYGNLTFSTGMTLPASTSALSFGATSGTQQITTNGKAIDFPLTFNGVGGTFRLQDTLTMGAARTATLTNGTLDLNGQTMVVGTSFTTATGTKNLTFNGGTLICVAPTTTAFNNAVPTGFTTTAGTGTGTISMTAATAKTFVGGGSTFNCTLNQGGAGALTITGSNTFANISNTTQPASVLFTAGTTTTFTSGFSLSGTAGNLITIASATAATHTLSKASGSISVSNCSITNSIATGGATWSASTANGNVDGGGNTGWLFSSVQSLAASVSVSVSASAALSKSSNLATLSTVAVSASAALAKTASLAANIQSLTTATGAVAKTASLSTSAQVVVTGTANIALSIPVAATASVAATTSGALGLTTSLAAAAQSIATISSALDQATPLSSAAQIAVVATAQLAVEKSLSASVVSTSVSSGAVAQTTSLSSSVQVLVTSSGFVDQTTSLGTTAQVLSTATGLFVVTKPLAATATSVVTATSALSKTAPLAASAQSLVTSSGLLVTQGDLSANLQVAATASGSIAVTKPLAANATVSVVASGVTDQLVPLTHGAYADAGYVDPEYYVEVGNVVVATARLATTLASVAVSTVTATASLEKIDVLTSSVACASTATAALEITKSLAANAVVNNTTTASLGLTTPLADLAGTGAITNVITADLAITKVFTATGVSLSVINGGLSIDKSLSASASANTETSSNLEKVAVLGSTALIESTASGNVALSKPLGGSGLALATINGRLVGIRPILLSPDLTQSTAEVSYQYINAEVEVVTPSVELADANVYADVSYTTIYAELASGQIFVEVIETTSSSVEFETDDIYLYAKAA